MIKEITPPQAWEMAQQGDKIIILDVRSSMEYEYVGHPHGAINIPWKQPPEWELEPGFSANVLSALSDRFPDSNIKEEVQILALCRSGARSHSAGEQLFSEGFVQVYNIVEGFEGDRDDENHRNTLNGWRAHGLPWEQS
jgi:rhodanese-related sulfurtransferase